VDASASATHKSMMIRPVGAFVFLRRLLFEAGEAAGWRVKAEELLAQAGGTVQEQFTVCGLSGAEAEVALLLLKGLALKEVAAVRNTSERNAREQARAVTSRPRSRAEPS